jgi:hypothetical protein
MTTLPPGWARWSYCAKAAHLLSTGQARDFAHACSLLAGRRRKVVTLAEVKANVRAKKKAYWWTD